MTYEQRVQQMAKEFIHDTHVDGDGEPWYEKMVINATPSAKIAVSAQADAIREFFFSSFCHRMGCREGVPATSFPEFDKEVEYINSYLMYNGYVPIPVVTSTPNIEQPSNAVPISPDRSYCDIEGHDFQFIEGATYEDACTNCGALKSNVHPDSVSPDKEYAYAKEVRRIAGMLHTSLEYAFDRELKPREIQDLMVEAARAMVAERATELIIYAYGSVADYHNIKETDVDEINTREFDQYLLGRGLVPSI